MPFKSFFLLHWCLGRGEGLNCIWHYDRWQERQWKQTVADCRRSQQCHPIVIRPVFVVPTDYMCLKPHPSFSFSDSFTLTVWCTNTLTEHTYILLSIFCLHRFGPHVLWLFYCLLGKIIDVRRVQPRKIKSYLILFSPVFHCSCSLDAIVFTPCIVFHFMGKTRKNPKGGLETLSPPCISSTEARNFDSGSMLYL